MSEGPLVAHQIAMPAQHRLGREQEQTVAEPSTGICSSLIQFACQESYGVSPTRKGEVYGRGSVARCEAAGGGPGFRECSRVRTEPASPGDQGPQKRG